MSENSSPLTLIVFKEGLKSRSFKFSPTALTRLSAVAGVVLLALLTSTVVALRYYRLSRQGDPARQQLLRDELEALRISYDSLKAQQSAAPAAAPAAPTQVAGSAPVATTNGDAGFLFRALPGKVVPPPNDAASVPIEPASPRASWQGNTLKVRFDLQFTGPEKGYQQGRIVILARGPNTIMAYPPNVLSLTGSPTLIDPDKGEYFSVSRFREVRADFGPVTSRSDLEEVEVMIFDQNSHVLLYRVIKPQARAATPTKPAAPEKEAPVSAPDSPTIPPAPSIESAQPEL